MNSSIAEAKCRQRADTGTPPAQILIVDDKVIDSDVMEALLRAAGYRTCCVASADQALIEIARHAPDLIVLDVGMPGKDGHELTRVLMASPEAGAIPVLIVSAMNDLAARLSGLQAGADVILSKPVDYRELKLQVRKLLTRKAADDRLRDQRRELGRQLSAQSADLQRCRAAMDATADAIFLVDRRTMRFIEVNTAAHRMLGYTRGELIDVGPAALADVTVERLAGLFDEIIAGNVSTAPVEAELRHRDGSVLQVEIRRQAHLWGADWTIVGVARDIAERQEARGRLHQMAHYDMLTRLPNRQLFIEALDKSIVAAVEGVWPVALLCVGLDHFRKVNDAVGRRCGDELLSQFAERLHGCLVRWDTLARLGGDEFAVVLALRDGPQGAAELAGKIRAALLRPFHLAGEQIVVTASVGIALYPDDALTADTLFQHADRAMNRAKDGGRDTCRFYTEQMNCEVAAQLALERALRGALGRGEFELHYQPKAEIGSGRLSGLEALLRWRRPGHGLVSPAEFIPVLEASGQINAVGSWVVDAACRQIGLWLRSGIGPVKVAVNVAGHQFAEGDLEGDVLGAIDRHGIDAGLLELELTESSLMANTERTIGILSNLKARGVRVSIDDFGTGYSSLAYLRRFPIDTLKIDIAFIRDVTRNPDDAAIVQAIVAMAHSLKLSVVAEGVEDAAQLAFLARLGCDQLQGYLYSRPLPLDALELLLNGERRMPAPPAGSAFQPPLSFPCETAPSPVRAVAAIL